MRGVGISLLAQVVAQSRVRPRPRPGGMPDGTWACFARHVRYWSGPRQGEDETLEAGAWELEIIADQRLLWERQGGESLHNGLPIDIDWRPGGLEQLVAHNRDLSFVLRIALGPVPDRIPMPFTALGTHVALSGICYFQPRVDA